jgi:hypothetical protein
VAAPGRFSFLASRFGARVARALFAIPLPGQRGLHALLLARLQIEGVPFGLLDDVCLQDLPFKTPQGAF